MKTVRTIFGHLKLLSRLAKLRVKSNKNVLKSPPLEKIAENSVKSRTK
jgi:hypothetical protein